MCVHKGTDQFKSLKSMLESFPVCSRESRGQGLLEQPFQEDDPISFPTCVLLGFSITGSTGATAKGQPPRALSPNLYRVQVTGSAWLTRQLAYRKPRGLQSDSISVLLITSLHWLQKYHSSAISLPLSSLSSPKRHASHHQIGPQLISPMSGQHLSGQESRGRFTTRAISNNHVPNSRNTFPLVTHF